MLCVAVAGAVLAFATDHFTLSWTHSVARTRWNERWDVTETALRRIEAEVQGPGAGMEIPDDALRTTQGWRYTPRIPAQREVVLAASGETPGGWLFCTMEECRELGRQAGPPLRLWVGDSCG